MNRPLLRRISAATSAKLVSKQVTTSILIRSKIVDRYLLTRFNQILDG
jgi:hypothetical protein